MEETSRDWTGETRRIETAAGPFTFHRGWGAQPYVRTRLDDFAGAGVRDDYDSLVRVLSDPETRVEERRAHAILRMARGGRPNVSRETPAVRRAMTYLVGLTQVAEESRRRTPGSAAAARASLRLIAGGYSTFHEQFNRTDGRFVAARFGGTAAMREVGAGKRELDEDLAGEISDDDDDVAQLAEIGTPSGPPVQGHAASTGRRNETGLPDSLKSGVEALSGMSLDHVRVHYNSSQPAALNALAYTQGTDIHVAPGQGRHLPHEAWHVVQQAQGRVRPTLQLTSGVPVNDDHALEHEADVMGARAAGDSRLAVDTTTTASRVADADWGVIQGYFTIKKGRRLRQRATDEHLRAAEARLADPGIIRWFRELARAHDYAGDLDTWVDQQLSARRRPTSSDPSPDDAGPSEPRASAAPKRARSRSLVIAGEEVRGTDDLPSSSDDELQEFQIGLGEADYTIRELRTLIEELHQRHAPHDAQRAALVEQYAYEQDEIADMSGQKRDRMDLDVDIPEDSSSDTDGSDTGDEESFEASPDRQQAADDRLRRLAGHLSERAFTTKLSAAGSASGADRDRALYKKGRPPSSGQLYRNESRFLQPTERVAERARVQPEPTPREVEDLAMLNDLLALGVPIAQAATMIESQFLVAQYRGIHYAPSRFGQIERRRHRALDERRQPTFSSAALAESPAGAAGYYYLLSAPGRDEERARYRDRTMAGARAVQDAQHRLRDEAPDEEIRRAVGRATDWFRPRTAADLDAHFYSESYDPYMRAAAESQARQSSGQPPTPLDRLFAGLPNASNPKVSTGDVPVHAERYAYGLKPYKEHRDDLLEPQYTAEGRPRRPYSGKTYTSLHPLSDYGLRTGAMSIVSLQNELRTNISQMIAHEHETQFAGLIEADRVIAQYKAKFPDFSGGYRRVYAEKYGLSEQLFNAFREALRLTTVGSRERTYVESLLSNYLAKQSELRAIDDAAAEARARRARLVYRTGEAAFGFMPPPLERRGARDEPPSRLPRGPEREGLLGRLAQHAAAVAPDAGARQQTPPPSDLRQAIVAGWGEIVEIAGDNLNCYIRSLVTAAVFQGLIERDHGENIVRVVADHLRFVGLRTERQMINAGGLVAAEVRLVLSEITGRRFDAQVHIVMWNPNRGMITEFAVNEGTVPVFLWHHGGHFDLIHPLRVRR